MSAPFTPASPPIFPEGTNPPFAASGDGLLLPRATRGISTSLDANGAASTSTLRSVFALILLFVALVGSPASAATVRRALVVAFNGSDRPGTAPLRYADDDGYRWRETLERLGVETSLLTVPDADTARLELGRGGPVTVPTFKALEAAVTLLAEKARADRAAGDTVDVLFVYVGHGQTDDAGRAYLTLLDGQLDQRTLYGEVVDRFGADAVHLIIDACHAGGVVGSRGADPALLAELKAALSREQLKARPHVGALFAESEEGETHEWSRLRAGIFSHAARSGLLGAADVNRDGAVAYSELDAFIASAIRGVKGARARLTLKTSAPVLFPDRQLVGPAPRGPVLRVPEEPAFSRLSIEDGDGVRLIDVNRQPGERVVLALPLRDAYWLRTASGDARLSAGELGGGITLAAAEVGARGGVEEGYTRGLFAVPFGRGFYEGFQASLDAPAVVFAADGRELATARPLLRFDGAWLGLGLAVGVPVTSAPLGARGVSAGVSLAWRSEGPVYLGARAQWTLASGAFDGASVHRFATGVTVGWRGWTRVAPFVEVTPQWVPTLVFRPGLTQGDLTGFGGRLSVGVMGSRDFLRGLRLAVTGELDAVPLDGERRASFLPGVELSMTF